MSTPPPNQGPLAGIRVLDMTRVVSGPYCSMLLGDFGAEVIKVEDPDGGDELRALGPPFLGDESVFFLSVNRNKKSVTLDLKSEEGKAALLKLVDSADVLVENFRPGVMDRLGLGADAMRSRNPRLIYCSISAFHPDSSYGDRPGYDLMISGMSGLQSVSGEPDRTPMRPGVNMVDMTAGTNAVMGILMALIARQSSGQGQKIDVSLMDGAVALMGQLFAIYVNTGKVPTRRPPHDLHSQIVPYGTFGTGDGLHLNVAVVNNKFWRAFCEALERPEWSQDERFATYVKRIENRAELTGLIAARFLENTRDFWIARLLERDVPSGPVRTIDEVVQDRYIAEAGMLVTTEHATAGKVTLTNVPIRMSGTPGGVRLAPPALGQHNAAVLGTTTTLEDET